jgi:hypothetical protein
MTRKALLSETLVVLFVAAQAVTVAAQPYSPIVTMSVTLPDGQTKELSAPESGLATVTLKDGIELGFRPTIQDDKPWTRVVVTIFRMPTASHPTQELGEVELRTGAAAVPSKTAPVFKIGVPRVSPPARTGNPT